VTLLEVTGGTLSALAKDERPMPYKIVGIDVHKRMLAVVVWEVEIDGRVRTAPVWLQSGAVAIAG
jgi:hypothetical protein